MPRILAIDYGKKRTGLAVTDPMQIISTALQTVDTKDLIPFLKQYVEQNEVQVFVVGEQKQLNNEPSASANGANSLVNTLNKQFPHCTIQRIDERFTSSIAKQAILDSGVKKMKRQDKSLVDSVSAVLILQTYLERISR